MTRDLNDSSFKFCEIATRENNEYVTFIIADLRRLADCEWRFDPEAEPCAISLPGL